MQEDKILIVQLADPIREPEKSIASLIFARTMAAMENEIYLFSMARSPLLYTKNMIDDLNIIDKKFIGLIKENIAELLNNPLLIYICSKSVELLGLKDDSFIKFTPPVQIAGMLTLHNLKQKSDHAYFF